MSTFSASFYCVWKTAVMYCKQCNIGAGALLCNISRELVAAATVTCIVHVFKCVCMWYGGCFCLKVIGLWHSVCKSPCGSLMSDAQVALHFVHCHC